MDTENEIYNFMKELNKKAAQKLIKVYKKNKRSITLPIIFPIYQKTDEKRVSEQEFRFAMAYLFKSKKYSFSIETPTKKTYNFKDKNSDNKRSAQTDMTIYNGDKKAIINIEFKAGNPEQKNFSKDFEKLIKEDVEMAAWCHIFKTTNDGTWKSVFSKFKTAFDDAFKETSNENKVKPIYFSFLVLEEEIFYWKVLNESNELKDFNEYTNFFQGIKKEEDLTKNHWKKLKFNNSKNILEEVTVSL